MSAKRNLVAAVAFAPGGPVPASARYDRTVNWPMTSRALFQTAMLELLAAAARARLIAAHMRARLGHRVQARHVAHRRHARRLRPGRQRALHPGSQRSAALLENPLVFFGFLAPRGGFRQIDIE